MNLDTSGIYKFLLHLEDPSRLVLEINDAYSKEPINEIYNYPIKQINLLKDNNLTRVVIDLYDHVFWHKPIQKVTDSGILHKH